jgi:hypothetical protein
MALLRVSDEVLQDPFYYDTLCRTFDDMEYVRSYEAYRSTILRVQHPEIPREDVFIFPIFIHFPGVEPFCFDFGLRQI